MGGHSEGLLAVDNYARRETSKDLRSQYRRMSFEQYHTMTAE